MRKSDGWVCTDPDNFQFRKKISENSFLFREFDLSLFNICIAGTSEFINAKENLSEEVFVEKYWDDEELWYIEEVHLDDYSEEEIIEYLQPYGYDYEDGEIIDESGNVFADNSLIAECIFEQQTQY